MKIVQLVPELKVGGVERGVVDLSRILIKEGHQAYVISHGGELVNRLTKIGATHYTLPIHSKNPFLMIRMIWKVAEIIEKEGIDIVHARSRVPAWIGFFAAFKSQRPFVTTCHGYYRKHFFSKVMGWGKRVIANSAVVANHMISDFGVAHDKIRIIPRGVDLEEFRFTECRTELSGDWTVALVGRMTPLKGHIPFLKAMAKVARVVPHIKIWFVGDAHEKNAGYRNEVQLMAKRLGLDRYTEFLGNREDIPALLNSIDLLVLPTIKPEAFGRVLIEAGACGVPVVASRVGGITEVIEDKKTGLLVRPEDPDELASAIIAVLRDRSVAKTMAHALRERVEKLFSLESMAQQVLKTYQDVLTHKKILIIKIGALGDVILAVPGIRAIREKYRQAHITVLVGEEAAPVIRRCPYIDNIIIYERDLLDRDPAAFMKFIARLQKESFDMSFDLQNNRRSRLLAFAAFIPKRYGYKNGKYSFLLNHGVPVVNKQMRPVPHQFHMLHFFGMSSTREDLEFWIKKEDERAIDQLLQEGWTAHDSLLIGINPGSSDRWTSKRWPLRNFVRLCDELAKMNIRVIFTGTETDKNVIKEIIASTKAKPVDASGRTSLFELGALIKRCAVFVTADSAPLHIAAAVQTPFVALFGPTDPERHLPPAKKYVVLHKKVRCAPCYKPECNSDLRCLKKITVDEVLKAIKGLL
ncbi:MAG: lipopolysaccharide heptosyltransferase II [Candidatus Omnitrophica bacterium]|nr:lipopolysaccharide heptosyltransferase II [Candidatus Omnitrophota bacterium]